MLSITTLMLVLFAQAALGKEHYHIVPVNSTSLCQHHRDGTCFTLDTFSSLINNKENGSITLRFYPGEHLLTQDMKFTNTHSVTLINNHKLQSNIHPRISCIENTGLYISNADIFVMQGLIIHGCISEEPVIRVEDVGTFYMQDSKVIENYRKQTLKEECEEINYISSKIAANKCIDVTNNNIGNQDCEFQASGVIHAYNSSITFDTCHFENNTAESKINGIVGPHGSAVSLINCEMGYITNTNFVGNQAGGSGAAIAMSRSIIDINVSIFKSNQANDFAGAIYISLESRLNIYNTTFNSNQANKCAGAMYIGHDSTVNLDNSTFDYNHVDDYSGGAIVAKEHSTVNVIYSSFERNLAAEGGAIYVVGENTSANINHSYFDSNQARFMGGAIFVEGKSTSVNINNSYFDSNQADIMGGALCVEWKSTANIINSHFVNNQASYTGGGIHFIGSVANTINLYFANNHAETGGAISIQGWNRINIRDSIYDNNQATSNGGAISVESHSTVSITCSIFDSNQSPFGGAIYVDISTVTFDQLSPRTEITRNRAANNGAGIYINSNSKLFVYGNILIADNIANVDGGGIYAKDQNEISFHLSNFFCITTNCTNNSINILNNTAFHDGGGMYLASTSVSIQDSNVTVCDNHADRFGGGLFFGDNSKVVFSTNRTPCDITEVRKFPNYYLHLKSNSAQKGGGVYVYDEPCSLSSGSLKSCFLSHFYLSLNYVCSLHQYSIPCNTYFENNIAMVRGTDIYGGMLDTCVASIYRPLESIYSSLTGQSGIMYMRKHVRWTWGIEHYDTIENDADFLNHISSDPMKVCFCVDNIVNCTFTHPTVHKKKGETFALSLVVTDQLGKPVNASLRSSLNATTGGRGQLKAGQQFRTIPDQCTDVEYNVYYNQNKTVLELNIDGPYGYLPLSKKRVNVVFDPCMCPLGFDQQYDPIDCSCDCTKALKPHIKHCWQEEGTFQLNDNNWIQNINNTGLIIHHCPFDYCAREPVNISLSESSDIQCAFNRTGIMCGKCDQGLSMVFATSQCQQCSDFYLFLLIPFGLAGIALVVFILLLNVTVATGTIHGLIFYANILAANCSILMKFDDSNILTVFVSWVNLDLGIETCFYNGMDSYGTLMLQLVFPAYVFFLIITIIVFCDRSQRIARLLGKRNPEATLYTLFLLSYSKLIRTIITALQFTKLDYPDGSQEIVWLYDTNVRYFDLNHIPRLLAAFIITILGAVYTSLLLFGQLFNKCSEYRMMKWTSHKYYIHFMKVHHAPLSDNHRYWVGLLLLARLTHYIISALTSDFIIMLSVLIMTFLLLIHKVVFKSYSKISINFLETLFISNLLLLSGATLFVQLAGGNQQALAIVSISISFIAFLGIVFYHILDSCGVKLKNLLTKMIPTHNRNRDNIYYTLVAIPKSEDENTEDESDEELMDLSNIPEDSATSEPYDPTRYITPPVIRSALPDNQLREPALDDLCPLTPADYNFHPTTPPTKCKRAPFTTTEIVVKKQ